MKKYRNIRLDTDNEILDNIEGFEDEYRTNLNGQEEIAADTIDDTDNVDFEDEYTEEFDESDFYDAEFADDDFEYEELDDEEKDDE